jgi:hypothetical protein
LLFRNGSVEGLTLLPIDASGTPHKIPGIATETKLLEGVEKYVRLLTQLAVPLPWSVHLSLVATKGVRLVSNSYDVPWQRDFTIDRDVIVLPEIVIEEPTQDLPALLKPSLDALWQASGWERSLGYDENGVRRLQRL